MTIKELINELSKYDGNIEAYITIDTFKTLAFPIETIEERSTMDVDEPPILVLKN